MLTLTLPGEGYSENFLDTEVDIYVFTTQLNKTLLNARVKFNEKIHFKIYFARS